MIYGKGILVCGGLEERMECYKWKIGKVVEVGSEY